MKEWYESENIMQDTIRNAHAGVKVQQHNTHTCNSGGVCRFPFLSSLKLLPAVDGVSRWAGGPCSIAVTRASIF